MPNSPVLKIVCAIRMERSTRKNRKQRKCFRNRNLAGGGLGSGYMNGSEMLARGYPTTESYSSCGAVSRAGMLTSAEISGMKGGLPGLSGGSRRVRKGKSKGSRKSQRRRSTRRRMHGGRYGMSMDGAEFSALGPRGGMMATAERMGCETGAGGPYPSPTPSTAPAVAMSGGALQLAPTPFLQEQTAGYSQSPSSFLDSVGAPILLNIPEGGRMGVPACAQTGGRRKQRKHRKNRKTQRKQRKNRKSSRKH
jgi:hypothetical protein